jgi:hypothetical protein
VTGLVAGFAVNMVWYLVGWHEIFNQAVPGMIVGLMLLVVDSLADEPPPKQIPSLADYPRTGRNRIQDH